jgi:hypothetical protein
VLALDVGHPMLQIFNGPLQKNSNEARAGFFLSLAPKINWASMLAKILRSQNKRSKNNLGETTWARGMPLSSCIELLEFEMKSSRAQSKV